MNISPAVVNTINQRMLLSPNRINSLKMLGLSQIEFAAIINKELDENPFLEEKESLESNADKSGLSAPMYQTSISYEFIRSPINALSGAATGKPAEFIEETVPQQETLNGYLTRQLRYRYPEKSREYQIGEYLVGNINKDGFLPRDKLREAFLFFKNSRLTAKTVRGIQSFDPPGICSRDIKEALLVQLKAAEFQEPGIEKSIILHYFVLLSKKKYLKIARKLKTTVGRILKAQGRIRSFEIKPARNFSLIPVQYIIPDVVLEKINENDDNGIMHRNEGFRVIIKDEILPVIKFNKEYDSYVNLGEKDFRKYLDEKRGKAVDLISCLKFRKSSLRKVTEYLILYQNHYLRKGPEFLKPITISELAFRIGISEGTLSRLVRSKYILTPWGIRPLRYFFSTPVKQEFGDISPTMIKEHIKRISASSSIPVSDNTLSALLAEDDIKISRRTVAKYRKQMEMLNSYERKTALC